MIFIKEYAWHRVFVFQGIYQRADGLCSAGKLWDTIPYAYYFCENLFEYKNLSGIQVYQKELEEAEGLPKKDVI